ncbi:unnamed protein product [Pedinophyceae sp. YPF-701]|nr:unnamed protein product [Pedinophyceae sp. YPF-701]
MQRASSVRCRAAVDGSARVGVTNSLNEFGAAIDVWHSFIPPVALPEREVITACSCSDGDDWTWCSPDELRYRFNTWIRSPHWPAIRAALIEDPTMIHVDPLCAVETLDALAAEFEFQSTTLYKVAKDCPRILSVDAREIPMRLDTVRQIFGKARKDVGDIVKRFPAVVLFATDDLWDWLTVLQATAPGLDIPKVLRSKPTALGVSPQAIAERIRYLQRTFECEEVSQVVALIQGSPQLLVQNSDTIMSNVESIVEGLVAQGDGAFSRQEVFALLRNSPNLAHCQAESILTTASWLETHFVDEERWGWATWQPGVPLEAMLKTRGLAGRRPLGISATYEEMLEISGSCERWRGDLERLLEKKRASSLGYLLTTSKTKRNRLWWVLDRTPEGEQPMWGLNTTLSKTTAAVAKAYGVTKKELEADLEEMESWGAGRAAAG